MYNLGLVSVSFRPLCAEEVLRAMVENGLKYVEWGSDVHAPYTDGERLAQVAALQERYGVKCSSYGTYFRFGVTPMEELPGYIRAAKLLGTDILRLWAGNRSPEKYTEKERNELFDQCRQAAAMAEAAGVTLCMECHRNTYTETPEGALEMMQAVASPAFRMYWQPRQTESVETNIAYLRQLKSYVDHLHVFHWKGDARLPLADGAEEWKAYLNELSGDRTLLLEFMPDNQVESLPAEAAALRQIALG